MAKGLPRSLSRADRGKRDIVKERIYLDAQTLTVDGATGVGFGSLQIGVLPEGNVYLLGAKVESLVITGSGTGHTATFDGDFGIGTTPASDGTITGADVNFVASTALGAATANVSPTLDAQNVTPAFIDATAGNLGLYLNLLIDDAAISADDVNFSLTGEVWIVYTLMGDD